MHRKYTPDHHEHHHDLSGSAAGLPRLRWRWVAALLVGAWLASGVFVVQPNERAAIWRCGKILDQLAGPGIHFGFPYGIDWVTRLKMYEQKRVHIGQGPNDRALGRAADLRRGECLTGDQNLILVSGIVQYDIVDARQYLTATGDVPGMVESLATAVLSTLVASRPVDDMLTMGRLEIQEKALAALRERLREHERLGQGLGVQVNSFTLDIVTPPAEVAQAFRDVATAREDKQRSIHEAEAYANASLPAARGEAERIRLEAEGYAAESREMARGDTSRFEAMLASLGSAREVTVKRLVLETVEAVLPKLRKVVLDEGAGRQIDLGLWEDQP